MEDEFLKIWSELEEIAERARREARGVAIKVCNLIRERYWGRIKAVAEKYGFEPRLGVEVNGSNPIGYVPVLYLISEQQLIPEVIGRLRSSIHKELGEWVADARLHVVILTKESRSVLDLDIVK